MEGERVDKGGGCGGSQAVGSFGYGCDFQIGSLSSYCYHKAGQGEARKAQGKSNLAVTLTLTLTPSQKANFWIDLGSSEGSWQW